jgi:Lon-like ATP-dependent protease
MEIIRLSGYDIPEKIAIATQYLVPKALKDAGLKVLKHEYENFCRF